jgi:hypothetical protein
VLVEKADVGGKSARQREQNSKDYGHVMGLERKRTTVDCLTLLLGSARDRLEFAPPSVNGV